MSLRKAINMGLAKKGATNKELSDYIGFKHSQTITAIKVLRKEAQIKTSRFLTAITDKQLRKQQQRAEGQPN